MPRQVEGADAPTKPRRTDREHAMRCLQRLLRHAFPLGAVLRREEPLSALVGWRHLLAMGIGLGTNSVVLDQYNDCLRRLAETMYLRDWVLFRRQTAQAVALSFAYSVTQMVSSRLYLILGAKWRGVLTRTIQDRYVRSQAYYRLQQADTSGAIPDADQRITEDVLAATTVLASTFYRVFMYSSNFLTAILRLATTVSPRYVFVCAGYLLLAERVREYSAPAMRVGMLNGEISHAMGEYRSAQLRLQRNAEPIVALRGTQFEKQSILSAYAKLERKQIEYNLQMSKDSWWYTGIIREMITPSLTAFLVEIPFISSSGPQVYSTSEEGMDANALILGQMTYITVMMTKMMKFSRAMLMLPRILLAAAGPATRLVEVLESCEELESASAARTSIGSSPSHDVTSIKLEGLTVQPPGGDAPLISDLSLEIVPGRNLLVVGENGVGKTSLFRTMTGLWPSPAGTITLPHRSGWTEEGAKAAAGDERMAVCFLPQRPYCPLGSLTDVLTYPLCEQAVSLEEMRSLLGIVELEYLMKYTTGDTQQTNATGAGIAAGCATALRDWDSTLSMSEKQRIAIARLIWHKPRFAVLDECTSTLSEEMAAVVYEACATAGIAVVSVSHRPKHKRYHSQVLTLGRGGGAWTLEDIGDNPPSTPPATPRSVADPDQSQTSTELPVDTPDPPASADAGAKGNGGKAMPKKSTLERIWMVLKIFVPKLSLTNRSLQLVCINIWFIVFGVFLQGKVLASLPGKLQALAIQSDRPGYISLTVSALAFRFLGVLGDYARTRTGHAISVLWQANLTKHVTECAMGHENAFFLIHPRITDMETRAVADVALCATTMQTLVTSMLTPLSSAVFVTRLLISANLPLSAIAIIWLYTLTGSAIVRFASPDLAGFAARTSHIEGVFRRMHQRLLANGESVAMMGGEEPELLALNRQSDEVAAEKVRQVHQQIRFDSGNYWFNNYLPVIITNTLRMSWSSVQYGTAAEIMAEKGGTGMSAQGLYIENLITQSFAAVTRLLSINTSFQTLAGHTHRVTDLLLVIEEVKAERAKAQHASNSNVSDDDCDCDGDDDGDLDHQEPRSVGGISLRDVEIVAPDGKRIVSGLTLSVAPGTNLRVAGTNGCGKSSLFRVLAGIWRPSAGSVSVPSRTVNVSQQPLVTTTSVSLFTYLSYPQRLDEEEAQVQAAAKASLTVLLKELGVMYLVEREGWESCKHWADVFSLGQLQCLGCVRMLFQLTAAADDGSSGGGEGESSRVGGTTTSFGIMDECTSALEPELEERIHRCAASNGISLLTFSQRESAAAATTTTQTRVLSLGVATPCGWELTTAGGQVASDAVPELELGESTAADTGDATDTAAAEPGSQVESCETSA